MSWFWLVLISTNLFSLNNLLDKFFCEKKFKNPLTLASLTNLLSGPFVFLLLFRLDFSGFSGWSLFLALVSGPLYFLMWVLWWQALTVGEVSRLTAVFNTAPVFNALLAVVFLKEELAGLKWLAIFFIVIGAILSTWNKENGSQRRASLKQAYFLVVLAAMVNSVANIITKFVSFEVSALAIYLWSFLGGLPFYLMPLAKKEIWHEAKAVLKTKLIFWPLMIRTFIAFLAICLYYLAIKLGPISLVVAVGGIGPLLVFLFSTLISFFWPQLIKEEINSLVLITKGLAIALVVIGVILIGQ